MSKQKPKIHILASGGTIAGLAPSALDFLGYTAGAARVEAVLAKLPEINDLADLQVENFCQVASENADPELWLRLARRAQEILDADGGAAADALVITAGTDTMEELAYFLNLLLKTAKPVVLTGAMRPLSAYGTDGPVNLYNAVAVAAAPECRGKGVLLVMNDTILAARQAAKLDSFRLHTFGGGELGSLGHVVAGQVRLVGEPWHRHTLATELYLADIHKLPQVEIFYMSAGADARLLGAMADLGASGVVLAAFGVGTYSDAVAEQLHKLLARGVVCAVASRTQSGFTVSHLPGLLPAADLSPQKARILLLLALACGKNTTDIERYFNLY